MDENDLEWVREIGNIADRHILLHRERPGVPRLVDGKRVFEMFQEQKRLISLLVQQMARAERAEWKLRPGCNVGNRTDADWEAEAWKTVKGE